ncbi:MAG: molybdopterin-guanine dinucleotide biosynthesis protein B [Nitrospirae bacterium]|nr:molybdopterin-guanine dinucleotide biosynthesis protein B [Nitrospirota bacterium]
MTPACIIGLCGHSGSGKTTLIERALPELKKQGLYVGVLKHTHHAMQGLDARGKDTARFFDAGADFVMGHDDSQGFARYHQTGAEVEKAIIKFPSGLDLIIVEGHKASGISGVWLEKQSSLPSPSPSPTGGEGCKISSKKIMYRDDPDYVELFLSYIHRELEAHHAWRSIMSGLLIGGKSSRMGSPKGLLEANGNTLSERAFNTLSSVTPRVLLLGAAELPLCLGRNERLPDVLETAGPLAGMLSAFRWAPDCAWLISSVDMPVMNEKAWQWLLGHRRPGVWAVIPRRAGSEKLETTGACYEPMLFDHVESLLLGGKPALQRIADHPKVLKPVIPKELEDCWRNINTPEDWDDVKGFLR